MIKNEINKKILYEILKYIYIYKFDNEYIFRMIEKIKMIK